MKLRSPEHARPRLFVNRKTDKGQSGLTQDNAPEKASRVWRNLLKSAFQQRDLLRHNRRYSLLAAAALLPRPYRKRQGRYSNLQ
jgi:hypothetical protein